MALKLISIRSTWLNLFKNNDFTIREVGANTNKNRKANVIRIGFASGLHTIDNIAAHINKEANNKAMIFVLHNGICRIRVAKDRTVFIDRELRELMGLSEPAVGKFLTAGDYDACLACLELDDKHCFLDGKKLKIPATLPIKETTWGNMVTWTFDTPLYIPLKGSTDRLEFMRTDQFHTDKNVAFSAITMQILIE